MAQRKLESLLVMRRASNDELAKASADAGKILRKLKNFSPTRKGIHEIAASGASSPGAGCETYATDRRRRQAQAVPYV